MDYQLNHLVWGTRRALPSVLCPHHFLAGNNDSILRIYYILCNVDMAWFGARLRMINPLRSNSKHDNRRDVT